MSVMSAGTLVLNFSRLGELDTDVVGASMERNQLPPFGVAEFVIDRPGKSICHISGSVFNRLLFWIFGTNPGGCWMRAAGVEILGGGI